MTDLEGFQRRQLRGLAHHLEPAVHVGQGGLTEPVLASVDQALTASELIKVRLVAFKEHRKAIVAELADQSGAALVGLIGNVAILYRPHPDPEKRKIEPPKRGHA